MKTKDKINWPERLRKLRKRLGITQRMASRAVWVHIATWQRWEMGEIIPRASMKLLLDDFENYPKKYLDKIPNPVLPK